MAPKKKVKTKASKEMLEMLNKAIAREIQVSIQYMWQHVQWVGVKGFAVHDEFKNIAVAEMKHAEAIAERLFYLGGIPTTKPSEIHVGEDLKQMIQADVKAEEEAMTMYKAIINLARKEKDETTKFLLLDILKDEEDHHDTFTSLLEEI